MSVNKLVQTAIDADKLSSGSSFFRAWRWHRKSQMFASLAIAEQLRVANLISMGNYLVNNPDADVLPAERQAWGGLADGQGNLLPEIREVLGLDA